MSKMVMPDKACREVDIEPSYGRPGARYGTGRTGTFEVTDPVHERKLRELGAFPANVGGHTRSGGFPCACGHQSLFRRCSKCGADNPRENSR